MGETVSERAGAGMGGKPTPSAETFTSDNFSDRRRLARLLSGDLS